MHVEFCMGGANGVQGDQCNLWEVAGNDSGTTYSRWQYMGTSGVGNLAFSFNVQYNTFDYG